MQQPASADPLATADLPNNRLSWRLDRLIVAIGQASAWLWLGVLGVVLSNVFSRFVLARGSIALEELSWHLFGAAMMLSLAYAVVRDDHVRVDVLREKFSLRLQAQIELAGIVLLALPVIGLMVDSLIPYAYTAFVYQEHSQAPSGLPYRFLFKSVLPLGLILVGIALFSRASRCSTLLFNFPRAISVPADDRNGGHPHP
ncbi:TRAP transporter small permease subunit [Pseudomonas sp. SA3-5]|jgi:TRAP-type mannitol/chloroaromatic compound transport system permease small subunit|uniref:TRAP transporter small permease protein n=1 Tax=Pseudomonas aestuarii TaxID=3018340 RepID=A0ABT4XHF6_9PSED|nr:TRAP transporter small permease subunit [Pseudomonas aestuarii]MDA7087646.1 TRAP transporter small permease subunit [Pseudomonas aestuarii]